MKTITPTDLHALLQGAKDVVLLDVRTPGEFAQAHVPGAWNVPLGGLEAARWQGAHPVFLLCQTGPRAVKAAEKFDGQGVVVEGGTQGWIAAGLPVTLGTGRAFTLERQVRIAAGTLVLMGVVLAKLVHPWFIGLAAFVGAGLVFAGISGWCGMGLLLARLPWNKRV